ncbi:AraC family transcriptional regulator [Vibrio sp. MACH09]|uniref:helix-turn-helix transcriptional regulator n=1 Tax=unclassified Vibrio TaxID=2614977 RepID=UPI0014937023|nr:AraC family transcriptional regulator [Vibrio sp. MACH09]NOI65334.1 helix-turn-helix transcriptional regulator [Vibrio sp. 99-8-1]GLO60673.1 AraC family transcriptional regulator [Vibrio sp. MACH09]
MLDKKQLLDTLRRYAKSADNIGDVFYAGNLPSPPPLAYQVHFPRIEMVLSGELNMDVGNNLGVDTKYTLKQGGVLFLPAESWNKPEWDKPVQTLTVMAGKQSFGMSLLSWDGEQFDSAVKESVLRRGPRVGTFILNAIEELTKQTEHQETKRLLITSLFSHIIDLIEKPLETPSKSHALFEAVRDYLEQHYHEPLSRESVAKHFYVSANYLSQLFQKEGKIKFNEYLNQIRLERAKYLLIEYDMKIKEVAHRCGFKDSNYFCRIFRNQTERSPSEYRAQYLSSHTE